MQVLERGTVEAPGADRTDETTAAGISWLAFHRKRAEIRRRWPALWDYKIVRGPFDDAVKHAGRVTSVLDVGATDRVWEPVARRLWPGVDYRSLDIDRTNRHDYYSFSDVRQPFDLVVCLEVLEHVSPAAAIGLLKECVTACRPGGHLLVSVPNVSTPPNQLEFTHQTAYQPMDLGGLLSWVGLEVVDGGRMWLGDTPRLILHRYLVGFLHRLLRVDYTQSIVMLARKPGLPAQ